MGILRGFGVWGSRTILVPALIMAIFLSGIGHLANEEFVGSAIESMLEQQSQDINDAKELQQSLLLECQTQNKDQVTFSIEDTGMNFNFNCNELETMSSEKFRENFINQASEQIIKQSKDLVQCEGFDCIRQLQNIKEPMEAFGIVTSAGFNKSLDKLSKLFFILALLGAAGVVLLSEGIGGRFIGLGYSVSIAGLPYIGMRFLESSLQNTLPSKMLFAVTKFMEVVSGRFLIVLILGILLIVIGLFLKFVFKVGKSIVKKKK